MRCEIRCDTRCDIFCAVVDNFGDIGVCWRLARQLVAEHGYAIRLWVDDLASFARICPQIDPTAPVQSVAGVEVQRWDRTFAGGVTPADVVVEAFACALPECYVAAMAACPARPVWINLEYLSAEPWVDGCHAMASPHPRLPLVKHFFFPDSGRTAAACCANAISSLAAMRSPPMRMRARRSGAAPDSRRRRPMRWWCRCSAIPIPR